MDYISVSQAAEKWGVTTQRVQTLCRQGRVEGVQRVGRAYIIPKNACKPKDARIKSGKYMKKSAGN